MLAPLDPRVVGDARIPVRIEIYAVPEGIQLSAGMTAAVDIDPRPPRGPQSSP